MIDIDQTFLPVGQMRQVSRVTVLDGVKIEGEMDLGPGHWVYPQHFPGDPIFPGTLLIEAAGQLVALWAWGMGGRGKPRLVRATAEFHEAVRSEQQRLVVRGEVRKKRNMHFATVTIYAAASLVATVTLVLAVLPAA